MPALQHLDVRKNKGRLGTMPPQPECVLESLSVNLPLQVQFNLWKAYASSVRNIQLRIEVASHVDVHKSIEELAARSPNLRTVHLLRMNVDEHTADECSKQMTAIQSVLPPNLSLSCSVTCSLCK